MSFQIWSIDRPTYLEGVLPLFQRGNSFTNSELVQMTAQMGLSSSTRRIAHLTQSWYVLGILERRRVENQAYRYDLSSFGVHLLSKLQFNPPLAIEFVHWIWYSGWSRSPHPDWGWSWVCREISDILWQSSPDQVAPRKLLADAAEKANSLFPEESPSFDIISVRSVTAWLAALDPPFLIKEDEDDPKSSLLSRKRNSCSPELLFLAIQLQYRKKGLSFGIPLLMDDELVDTVCSVCMLAPEQFWPMAEVCSLTFPTLIRKETTYGTSWTVTEPAPFTPPAPRSAKPRSR